MTTENSITGLIPKTQSEITFIFYLVLSNFIKFNITVKKMKPVRCDCKNRFVAITKNC